MNAHQSISYRDRLNAENKARRKRLGFDGKQEPVEKKQKLRFHYREYDEDQFDAHVVAYREWMALNLKFYGSPVRQYVNRRAAELGFTYNQMIGITRKQAIAKVRQLIMWEIKNIVKPDISYPEIGRIFGGRDHTTVLHAIRAVEARKARDVEA